jgi:hypothetical protein
MRNLSNQNTLCTQLYECCGTVTFGQHANDGLFAAKSHPAYVDLANDFITKF